MEQIPLPKNNETTIAEREKFLKVCGNGKTHRYVYYHCTHASDRYCKEKPIREENLVEQLLQLIDKLDVDEIKVEGKIEQEIEKYRKFSYIVLGKETEFDHGPLEADVKNYAKHVLRYGTKDEKRELLNCFESKVEIRNKQIYINIKAS